MSGLDPGNFIERKEVTHRLTPIDAALWFIGSYGQIDGAHHKTWVLDQVARILNGTPVIATEATWERHRELDFTTGEPSAEYLAWVKEMRGEWDEENEEFEYSYDEGIAP